MNTYLSIINLSNHTPTYLSDPTLNTTENVNPTTAIHFVSMGCIQRLHVYSSFVFIMYCALTFVESYLCMMYSINN